MSEVIGAVFVGGSSRRMGRDKAMIEVAGKPLWKHQVDVLRIAGVESVVLSVNGGQIDKYADWNGELIVDQQEGGGPMGGLASVLSSAKGKDVLALAVDVPAVNAELLSRLLRADGGAVFRRNDRYETLIARYPAITLEVVERMVSAGELRMQELVDELVEKGMMEVLEVAEEEGQAFKNWNFPQDMTGSVTARFEVQRLGDSAEKLLDDVVREEPLEIRVEGRAVAVIMRTPGSDEDLVRGFLYSEGIVRKESDFFEVSVCPSSAESDSRGNVVDVALANPDSVDFDSLTRHVFTASSCGICGKATIESALGNWEKQENDFTVASAVVLAAPDELKSAQETFASTGGLHGCGVFDADGRLLLSCEDVGRHNALDKLVGRWIREGEPDLRRSFLLLSGRISFELMQKAHAAGIPLVAGISAPSSLAVEFAQASGQGLAGFVRNGRMNVYANAWRFGDRNS
ncbi:MAG: formate dehydrogenase accessory sulfurtransferase FdhD [Verrucomicrobiota bacterium]